MAQSSSVAQRVLLRLDQSPHEMLVSPTSWSGWERASRTTEVSCWVQPCFEVHFHVWSFGWTSVMFPICCAWTKLRMDNVASSMCGVMFDGN